MAGREFDSGVLGVTSGSPFGTALVEGFSQRGHCVHARMSISETGACLSDHSTGQAIYLTDLDRKMELLWFPNFSRRTFPICDTGKDHYSDHIFALDQWDGMADWFDAYFSRFVLNRPAQVSKWSSRPASTVLAQRVGISTPSSRICFGVEDAQDFILSLEKRGAQAVLKRISDNRFFLDGRVSEPCIVSHPEFNTSTPFPCPIFLEERIEWDREYRLFVCGGRYVLLENKRRNQSKIDARLEMLANFNLREGWDAPMAPIHDFLKAAGLAYCCFDFVERQGEKFLVDVNPIGTTDGMDVNIRSAVVDMVVGEVSEDLKHSL